MNNKYTNENVIKIVNNRTQRLAINTYENVIKTLCILSLLCDNPLFIFYYIKTLPNEQYLICFY